MRLGNDPARGRESVSLRGVLSSAVLSHHPDSASEPANIAPRAARTKTALPRSSAATAKPHLAESLPVRFDPLYLFYCSVMWHKHANPNGGWELVHALRSLDSSSNRIATSFLAVTEDARFLSKDLRQQRRGTTKTGLLHWRPYSFDEVNMEYAQGSHMPENCTGCKLRKSNWFCGFSSDLLKSFSTLTRPSFCPGGTLLFVEGQRPRGAFIVCSGRVKLSTTSREGKVLILKVAGPGEVLGLSAVVAGSPYETTAETVGPCQINFAEKDSLLRMIEGNAELSLRSIRALSTEFQSVYRDIHELVLARSSAGKLARLLLSWTKPESDKPDSAAGIPANLTHEEMAQMIGASRETVTRLLGDLKKKSLIRVEGTMLVIRDRSALEQMAA
jgi:CRP/FNR family transcriptional regulator, cyclic AMP receptor protein